MSTEITTAQQGHAAYRIVELRATHEAACAAENAAAAAAELKALGGKPIDEDLPDDRMAAAAELERRAYELTNPPRRTAG
jgi:hypothetical protein